MAEEVRLHLVPLDWILHMPMHTRLILLLALTASTASGQQVVSPHQHVRTGGEFCMMTLSPDRATLSTAGLGQNIDVRETKTGEIVSTIEKPDQYTMALRVSPNGRTLAAGVGGDIHFWNLPEGKLRGVVKEHRNWVRSLAFTPDGEVVVSGSNDRAVVLWRVQTLEKIDSFVSGGSLVAITPQGDHLATVGLDHSLEIREVKTCELVTRLSGHQAAIRAIAFSPDGKTLASGATWDDTTIRLWNVATGMNTAVLAGRDDPVESVAFSCDGKLLAASRLNGQVEIWDLATQKLTRRLPGGVSGMVGFGPRDELLLQAYGMSDAGAGVYLWPLKVRRGVAKDSEKE